MNGFQNPHHKGFLGLLAGSVAVLFAFGIFLQTGWRSCQAVLNTVSGDADKLKDFTVDLVHFMDNTGQIFEKLHLENGILQNDFHVDDLQKTEEDRIWFYMTGTVLPEEHDALDAEASSEHFAYSGVTQFYIQSDHCLWMANVNSEQGVVRFPMGELTLEQPISYYALKGKDGRMYDYQTLDTALREQLQNDTSFYFGEERISMGDTWGFCQRFPTELRTAGLYRVVKSHIGQDTNDLPPNGMVQGKPVLLQSTALGETELFYSTPECSIALEGYDMEDGSVLFLYLDQNNQLAADLVNKEGVCADRWQNIPVEVEDFLDTWLLVPDISRMVCSDRSQIVLLLSAATAQKESCLLAMRIENGKFVTKEIQRCPVNSEPILVQLNRTGDEVLEITESVKEFATKNHIRQDKTPSDSYVESYRVTVKAFPDGEVLYEGNLDVGTQRDWKLLGWYTVTDRAYHVTYDRNWLSIIEEEMP